VGIPVAYSRNLSMILDLLKEKWSDIIHKSWISLFLVKFQLFTCLGSNIMSRLTLLLIWIFSGSSMLCAQDFLGSGRLEAHSNGTTETVQFVSTQLGGYLYNDAQRMVFEMKTTSFFQGQTVDQQNMLREIWKVDAYPLMNFTFDVNGIDMTQSGKSKLSVEWKMGDQVQSIPAVMTHKVKGNTVTVSWSFPVSLKNMGLEIPATYVDRMSDEFIFNVSDFALIQR
ncbi:MAG: hypothetical protein AAFP02_20935, partial [Bacteroidota bacterium]